MVTIDLNLPQRWEELFLRVETGETLRVVRGNKEIAFVEPAEEVEEDDAFLDLLVALGAKQVVESIQPARLDN